MAQRGCGQGRWEEAPHLWPTHKAGWGFSQELESLPLDRVRKKGAAAAATKQDSQGQGRGGTEREVGRREKSGQKTKRTEKEP